MRLLLDRMMRLSYHERVAKAIPTQLLPLLPPKPEGSLAWEQVREGDTDPNSQSSLSAALLGKLRAKVALTLTLTLTLTPTLTLTLTRHRALARAARARRHRAAAPRPARTTSRSRRARRRRRRRAGGGRCGGSSSLRVARRPPRGTCPAAALEPAPAARPGERIIGHGPPARVRDGATSEPPPTAAAARRRHHEGARRAAPSLTLTLTLTLTLSPNPNPNPTQALDAPAPSASLIEPASREDAAAVCAELLQRSRDELHVLQARYRRNVGEMWARFRRDIGEM